jgi:hypothetical protein
MAVSRPAAIAIGLYAVWLLVFILLAAGGRIDRDTLGLFGLLPLWGPLLAIAVLSVASPVAAWLERKLRRR